MRRFPCWKRFLLFIFGFVPIQSYALHFSGNGFYFSDAFKVSTNNTASYMAGDAAVMIKLEKNKKWHVGWQYVFISSSVKTTSQTDFSTGDMGPRVEYYLDKKKAWGIGLGYNLIVASQYKDAETGETVKWRGSSLKADFGYNAEFDEWLFLGLRISYYSGTFNEQFVGGTTYTKVAYSRAWIYPTMFFRVDFD